MRNSNFSGRTLSGKVTTNSVRSRTGMIALAAATALSSASWSLGAVATWDGSVSNLWAATSGADSNWTGGLGVNGILASGDSAVFGATGVGSAILTDDLTTGAAFNIAGFTFNAGASAYVINPLSGTNNFTLTGNFVNNSASTQTVNSNFTLGATNRTFTTTAYTGNITLNGVLSGTAGLTTTGGGTLTLTGNNSSFSGTTVMNGAGDVLRLASNTALGTSAVTLTGAASTVELTGGITVNNAISFTVTRTGTTGPVLRNASGTNTYSGTISHNTAAGGQTIIESAAGQLNMTGTVGGSTSSRQLIITGAGNTTFAAGSTIATTFTQLRKDGIGTLTLAGTSTLNAAIPINGGTLKFDGTTGTFGTATTSNVAFAANGGRLQYQAPAAGGTLTLGTLTFGGAGDNVVQSDYGTSGNAAISFTSLVARPAGTTGNFVTNGGTAATNKITFTTTPVVGALTDRGLFFGGNSYATYDAAGYVRAYATTDTDAVVAPAGATLGAVAATSNVFQTGSITAQTTASTNTINIAGAHNLDLASGQTLGLNGLLKSGGGTSTITGDTGITTTTAAAELLIRTNASTDTLVINTPIVANGVNALTKSGAGTLTLAGAANYTGATTILGGTLNITNGSNNTSGNINVANGVLNVTGNLGTNTTNGNFRVGTLATVPAVMNIGTGANITRFNLFIGDAGAGAGGGAVYQTDGSLTLTQGAGADNLRIGSNGGAGSTPGGYGYYKLSGGSLSANEIGVGGSLANTVGILDVSGGTATSNGYIVVGRGAGNSSGLVNVTGGTVNAARIDMGWGGNAGASTVLNVASAAAPVTLSGAGAGLNLTSTNTTGSLSVANVLTNGNLTTTIVRANVANPTAHFNFNGGKLTANSTNSGATFFAATNIDAANVYAAGGTVDNNSTSITIGANLLAPAGSGIGASTISVGSGGTGYVGAPLVTFTGGSGTGATGYAVMSGGTVSSIVVTSPGIGYRAGETLTANFSGGGTANFAPSITGIAVATNTSGGMIFTGSGTTTLAGANTYTGATSVNGGLLRVTGSLAGAASVTSGNAIGGTGTIGGTTTLAGNSTLNLVDGAVATTFSVGNLTIGGTSGNFSLLNLEANGTSADKTTVGGVFNVNAGGGNITITNLVGGPTSGQTIDLLTFTSGTGAGFATGSGTTVGGLTLTNPNLSFGVTGSLLVSSTKVQLVTSGAAPANTAYWSGVKGGNWTDNSGGTGNFSSDAAGASLLATLPSTTTDVIFAANGNGAPANLSTNLGQDFSIKSLTFASGTPSASINGSNILTIGTGGITIQSGNGGATLGNTTVALGANQTWTNDSTTAFAVNSAVSNGANLLTVSGTGDTNVTGIIGNGAGGLTKSGTGTLTLFASNTYTGPTTINAGKLVALTAVNTLPAATALTITSPGAFELSGSAQTVASLSDGGVTGGNIASTGFAGTLTVNQTANTTFSGTITDQAALTKSNTGKLTLTGVNTFSGATTVAGGTLHASDTLGLSLNSNLVLNGGALEPGGNFARVGGTNPGEIQLTGGTSGFTANGADIQVAIGTIGSPTPLVWGTLPFNPGALLLNNSTATNKTEFLNAIDLGAASRFVVSDANVGVLSGVLSGTAGLRVDGAGTVLINNASNSFAGGVIIDSGAQGPGVLRAAASNALGTGAVTIAEGGNTSTGRLELIGGTTLANAISVNGRNNNSVAIQNISGNNELTGTLSLNVGGGTFWIQSDAGNLKISNPTAAITVASGARTLTLQGAGNGEVSGPITNGLGSIALVKSGAGTWTLSGVNTYTGATAVNGGVLKTVTAIQNGNTLAATAGGVVEVPLNGSATGVTSIGLLTTTGTGSRVELHDNDLIINYGAGPNAYADTVLKVKSGLVSLGGTGTEGISSVQADGLTPGTSLAVVDNAVTALTSLSGFTIPNPTTSVLVKFTWLGDANLDGIVDGTDYALTDSGFAGGGTTWNQGDYNYSGGVDGTDYALIDTGFGSQSGTLPEPTALGLLGLGAMGMLRRRRRQA